MTQYFIIPGLGNSGEEHWQTYFERSGNNFHRISQENWETPDCEEWVKNIEKTSSCFDPEQSVFVGHSLGCIAIVHWAKKYNKIIKGAMLVAPADIENTNESFSVTGFTPIPLEKLKFKTIVVASSDDPWVALERSRFFAESWGSEFINIGEAEHINAASGYGPWKAGLNVLKKLS